MPIAFQQPVFPEHPQTDMDVLDACVRISGCSLQDIARFSSVGDALIEAENGTYRNEIAYVYSLLREMYHRCPNVTEWLHTPIHIDASPWEWDHIARCRLDYYYRTYTDYYPDYLQEPSPHQTFPQALEGWTPYELWCKQEWEIIWEYVATLPLIILPTLDSRWDNTWHGGGWRLPHNGLPQHLDPRWGTRGSLLRGDDPWELDDDYEEINREIEELFPLPEKDGEGQWWWSDAWVARTIRQSSHMETKACAEWVGVQPATWDAWEKGQRMMRKDTRKRVQWLYDWIRECASRDLGMPIEAYLHNGQPSPWQMTREGYWFEAWYELCEFPSLYAHELYPQADGWLMEVLERPPSGFPPMSREGKVLCLDGTSFPAWDGWDFMNGLSLVRNADGRYENLAYELES